MNDPNLMNQGACPCASGADYRDCCGLYHSGECQPASTERLMRSRFSAFARRDAAYLLATWDCSKRPAQVDFAKADVEWQRLEIISCKKGGARDDKGVVEFKAYYRHAGEDYLMHEISRFHKKEGRWYYLDGAVKAIRKVAASSEDLGRNAPCACGSGKKYKRCCGR